MGPDDVGEGGHESVHGPAIVLGFGTHDGRNPTPAEAALDGLKVIDTATLLAGPLIATLLGDYGADVVKVEHPKGDALRSFGWVKDGVSLWWLFVNRNKACVSLSLSQPDGAGTAEGDGGRRRRPGGELPARHHGALGPRLGGTFGHQPPPRHGAGDGLRPDRPLLRPGPATARWPSR